METTPRGLRQERSTCAATYARSHRLRGGSSERPIGSPALTKQRSSCRRGREHMVADRVDEVRNDPGAQQIFASDPHGHQHGVTPSRKISACMRSAPPPPSCDPRRSPSLRWMARPAERRLWPTGWRKEGRRQGLRQRRPSLQAPHPMRRNRTRDLPETHNLPCPT